MMEPHARFELATPGFVSRCSGSDELVRQKERKTVNVLVPRVGLEPTRLAAADFESAAFPSYATGAMPFTTYARDKAQRPDAKSLSW